MFDDLESEPPRSHDRQVWCRQPKPVWVDLGAVFRIRRPCEHFEEGLDLRACVPSELLFWEKTTTSHWVGYVSFVMPKAHADVRVSQLVMEYALELREDAPTRGAVRQPEPLTVAARWLYHIGGHILPQ